jgi:2-hydroxy-3-keto-5-methylthiopentenyl-1-phosphate phosphatase
MTRTSPDARPDPLPDPPRSTVLPAVPVPPLEAGQPPLAILVDYDGTIAQTDVSDALLAEFVSADWEAHVAEYDAGVTGSRRLMAWEIGLISADPAALSAKAAAQPHDPSFRPFAERARAAGVPVEVVSDGFGFFIEPALEALGLGWLPVVTAATTFEAGGSPRIEFPNGDTACFVCGTCKRNRVRAHQAAGRAVVFVGDGPSDRYAAGYADVVFAKQALVQICLDAAWPFERWTAFSEIDSWLDRALSDFEADPSSLAGPRARPLFCGAEVWGPGRFDPG